MKITLTDREADVMQALWDRGPSLVSEVREHLHDRLAYTTVLTVLRILETKGYVRHEGEGRVHRYFPAVERQAARKSAIRHLADKLFSGSADLLFAQMVSDRRLTPKQIRRLEQLLKQGGQSRDES